MILLWDVFRVAISSEYSHGFVVHVGFEVFFLYWFVLRENWIGAKISFFFYRSHHVNFHSYKFFLFIHTYITYFPYILYTILLVALSFDNSWQKELSSGWPIYEQLAAKTTHRKRVGFTDRTPRSTYMFFNFDVYDFLVPELSRQKVKKQLRQLFWPYYSIFFCFSLDNRIPKLIIIRQRKLVVVKYR